MGTPNGGLHLMPYPCPDCCQGYPCGDDCSGGVPDRVTVDITGADDGNCTWTTLDGSYVLDYAECTRWWAQFTYSPIVELYRTNGACSNSNTVGFHLAIKQALNEIHLDIQVKDNVNSLFEAWRFSTSISRPTGCCSWTLEPLTYVRKSIWPGLPSQDYGGDLTTTTVEITAAGSGC